MSYGIWETAEVWSPLPGHHCSLKYGGTIFKAHFMVQNRNKCLCYISMPLLNDSKVGGLNIPEDIHYKLNNV